MTHLKPSLLRHMKAGLLVSVTIFSPSLFAQVNVLDPVWKYTLNDELQGRIYQTIVLPGETPRLIATTPDEVFMIERGKPSSLFRLQETGSIGQSAILPSRFIGGSGKLPQIAVLNHNHHAVESFQLMDVTGNTVYKQDDPRHFYYRISPQGDSYVGIDSGNVHTALAAEKVTYRFFNMENRKATPIEVISEQPSHSFDSAYSPDGKVFFINSQVSGLTAYNPLTGERLWSTRRPAKRFAVGLDKVLMVEQGSRNVASLWHSGKAENMFDLHGFDMKENIRNVSISPNGKYGVITGRQHAIGIDTETGNTKLFPFGDGFAINSVDVNNAGLVVMGAQSDKLTHGVVRFANIEQAKSTPTEIQLEHRRSNAWIPMVKFEGRGEFLTIRTMEEIQLYSIAKN